MAFRSYLTRILEAQDLDPSVSVMERVKVWERCIKEYEQLKVQSIKLKKKQKVFLEDAQYYIEEVRKKIINELTYEKVYKFACVFLCAFIDNFYSSFEASKF